jgi:hypothetical protein
MRPIHPEVEASAILLEMISWNSGRSSILSP